MSNTATTTPEFANYCGESVIVLEIEHTEYGTLAFIQFEDGREDLVPVTTLNFLNYIVDSLPPIRYSQHTHTHTHYER